MKLIIILSLCIIILIPVSYFHQNFNREPIAEQRKETAFERRIQEKTKTIDTSNWETYHSERGYSLQFDPEYWWLVENRQNMSETDYSLDQDTAVLGGLSLQKDIGQSFSVGILESKVYPDVWFPNYAKEQYSTAPGFKRSKYTTEKGYEVIQYLYDIVDWHEVNYYYRIFFIHDSKTQKVALVKLELHDELYHKVLNNPDLCEDFSAHVLKVVNSFSFEPISNEHKKAAFEKRIQKKKEAIHIVNWETYRDDDHGYEFKYHSGFWTIKNDDTMITAFDETTKKMGEMHSRAPVGIPYKIELLQTEQDPDDWFVDALKNDTFSFAEDFKRSVFYIHNNIQVIRYFLDVPDLEGAVTYFEIHLIQNVKKDKTFIFLFTINDSDDKENTVYSEEHLAQFLRTANTFVFME
ncbi:hypothetical protein KKH43_03395 [Patescibacteria group bacterium]|nr:hypothetical protein [Patescibacteria group bacterium]